MRAGHGKRVRLLTVRRWRAAAGRVSAEASAGDKPVPCSTLVYRARAFRTV